MVQVIYWLATITMCCVFAFSANMYLTNPDMVKGFFTALDYPSYLVYPLAFAKILGIIAVLSSKGFLLLRYLKVPDGMVASFASFSRKIQVIKEWAYAGFFFDAVLATAAHMAAGDGSRGSLYAIIAVLVSRLFESYLPKG